VPYRQAARDRERKKDEEIAALKAQLVGKSPSAEGADEEDAPLTVKKLKELRELELKEQQRLEQENGERSQKIREASSAQEQFVRTVYSDFDETLGLAKELVSTLHELVPEKHKQAQIVRLWQDLNSAHANADKLDVDDYNGAFIAYEIGRLHPNYGKKTGPEKDPKAGGQPSTDKAGGQLSPEKMDRVVKNSQRAVSSAGVTGGGGKVVVAAEDMTLEALSKLTSKERMKFAEDHPKIYRRIVRG